MTVGFSAPQSFEQFYCWFIASLFVLNNWISFLDYLSQETLIRMCIDVARGLEYLASHRLIHRDVATRNCLVADDLTIKIADFGMSRDIYSNNYYKVSL